MEKIIAQIAEKFIKKIIENISSGKTLDEIEPILLKNCKETAVKIVEGYIAVLDKEILTDKGTRKKCGYSVERKGDKRRIYTSIGEITYSRTYYKKASGGYEYLTDKFLGVETRERVSVSVKQELVNQAKEVSYGKSTKNVTDNEISRQTVMLSIRQSRQKQEQTKAQKVVSNLHIDADEAHVTMLGGTKAIVPLISVYEGIERENKRGKCKNIFHISEYGMNSEDLWEKASEEIYAKYDLSNTKIYLHGDGGSWIQKGLENLRNTHFVLDQYHKNKALMGMLAGVTGKERENFDRELRWALNNNEKGLFEQLTYSLCELMPERKEEIQKNGRYLAKFIEAIAIRTTDYEANNGGCTEPHISHILANRLSTRPMAWSGKTLEHLAPILAGNNFIIEKRTQKEDIPLPLKTAEVRARRKAKRGNIGLPNPESIGHLGVNGKITGTQKILKLYC